MKMADGLSENGKRNNRPGTKSKVHNKINGNLFNMICNKFHYKIILIFYNTHQKL